MTIIVTGGCGFIGTNFVRQWLSVKNEMLINIDKLTYASIRGTAEIKDKRHKFFKLDIIDKSSLLGLMREFEPRAIIHFAAETHVDRSIKSPESFVLNNINGTHSLLETALDYFLSLDQLRRSNFKLINISTDEVYGALDSDEPKFNEQSSLAPNSPYSATKASADMLARSFFKTYSLPVITTRCSNNFGAFQNNEKFIPTILNAIISGGQVPVYGDGKQIRDWLYVLDHVNALLCILDAAQAGSIYNIGGGNELENINLIKIIHEVFSKKSNDKIKSFESLISYTDDRLGHDFRYAIDSNLIFEQLGWSAKYDFLPALNQTIDHYLEIS